MLELTLRGTTFGNALLLDLTRKQARRLIRLCRKCRFVDLVITAANVKPVSDQVIDSSANAGEAITQGQSVYLDTDGKWYKSDANGVAAKKDLKGIALNNAAADQPLAVQKAGVINMGATVAVGTIYVVSATAGGVAPSADLVSGMDTIIVGVGITTSNIRLNVFDSGAAVP